MLRLWSLKIGEESGECADTILEGDAREVILHFWSEEETNVLYWRVLDTELIFVVEGNGEDSRVRCILMPPSDQEESDETFLLFRSDGVSGPVEVNEDMISVLMSAEWIPTGWFRDKNGNRLPNLGQLHTTTNQKDVVGVMKDLH